jgi:hypothetical protein
LTSNGYVYDLKSLEIYTNNEIGGWCSSGYKRGEMLESRKMPEHVRKNNMEKMRQGVMPVSCFWIVATL